MEQSHAVLAAFVERAMNSWLGTDPRAAQDLAGLDGIVIGLEVTTFPVELFFMPTAGKIRVAGGTQREPHTWIRGRLLDLIRLSRGGQRPGSGARLVIEGDVAAGHAFQRILKTGDFDWEELLAHRLGDVAANGLARGIRATGYWAAQSFGTLNAAVGEYLHEEAGLVPGKRELRRFTREVDDLRDRVETLEIRAENARRS